MASNVTGFVDQLYTCPPAERRYENRVIGGVLSVSLFCGGHNYFVSQVLGTGLHEA